jgi:hypothetical protein
MLPAAQKATMDEQSAEATEVISFSLPHEERFVNVARIVVGGLAARLDVPYESMDDLQLAVETILSESRYAVGPEVTIEVELENRSVNLLLGPLDEQEIRSDLEASDGTGLGLDVLLTAVVDSISFEDRAGQERWLRLEKGVNRPLAT